MQNPQLVNWLLLGFLAIVWGTSFMTISVAIQGGFSPLTITLLRIACAAVVLVIFIKAKGLQLPNQIKQWTSLFILGFFGSALPFMLISWGQQTVPSGITGILMSIMPLATMLLAHFMVADERLNLFKIIGFIVAFSAVFLLLNPVENSRIDLLGSIAILSAACSYALNTVLIRKLPVPAPMVAGSGMMLCSLCLLTPWALSEYSAITDQLIHAKTDALLALLWLGVMPTGVASIVYFIVVNRAGPSFLSNCNFLIPVVAFVTGAWLLNEPVTLINLISLTAILTGITLTRINR